MNKLLVPVLFWLSVPLSPAFSATGVLMNKYWLVLMGTILFFPISYYFNGSPTIHGYGLFLPLFQVISAAAVREGNKLWAWLFLLPALLAVIGFIVLVWIYQVS